MVLFSLDIIIVICNILYCRIKVYVYIFSCKIIYHLYAVMVNLQNESCPKYIGRLKKIKVYI